MAEEALPEPRAEHESALVDNELHLFGGKKKYPSHDYYFPRNEIWTYNVREEKKWIRRYAKGKNIPPPCYGARCVVINGIMYSYGGCKEDGEHLGEVYGLDPKKMEWIQVASPTDGQKPWQRSFCCLWAIGGKVIMFGGRSRVSPQDRVQSEAQYCSGVYYATNNEIYEFVLEEGRRQGYWLDVELSGRRPEARYSAAMETIDQNRGLLHGGYAHKKPFEDAFVIDLGEKKWICINFLPKPSARWDHRICRLEKKGLEEKNCFVMIGGCKTFSDEGGYIIDFEKRQSHKIDLPPDVAPVWHHSLHCVANQDGSADLILSGGYSGKKWEQMMNVITLGPSNDFCKKIECLFQPGTASVSEMRGSERIMSETRERIRLRKKKEEDEKKAASEKIEAANAKAAQEEAAKEQLKKELRAVEAQLQRLQEESEKKTEEWVQGNASYESKLKALERQREQEKAALESKLEALKSQRLKEIAQFDAERQALQQIVNISPKKIQLTQDKLATRAHADILTGYWSDRDKHVAVKKFHFPITKKMIPLLQSEVRTACGLYHANIVRVIGAIMSPGEPLQIVFKLLQGSISEAMDAAYSSGSYLSNYEQLSVAVDVTSGVAYLHKLCPNPYVHGDICSTSVLVTRQMRVKVADMGSAKLLDICLFSGPMSTPYVAPERLSPTPEPSSLSGDVYSLGVLLIEIFTGEKPDPQKRMDHLRQMMKRDHLYDICSRMTQNQKDSRPTAGDCLETLEKELGECMKRESSPKRRRVKGEFEGRSRLHKVVLLSNLSFKFVNSDVSLNLDSGTPLLKAELTPNGEGMTIEGKNYSLSFPSGAVNDKIVVLSRLLTDGGAYKSKTGVMLTDVIQLLPLGTKLQKVATLKIKHNFDFRENHVIRVTLNHEKETDRNAFRPLCVFTALERNVDFEFGSATLLANHIIVRTKRFCSFCGENNGCSINLSGLVLAPKDLKPSDFVAKLCICKATDEEERAAIKEGCVRAPGHELEMIEKQKFRLCECGIKGSPVLSIIATINESSAWEVVSPSSDIDFRRLREIFESNSIPRQEFRSTRFICNRSLKDGNSVTVQFTLQWTEAIELFATFKAKNHSDLPTDPEEGLDCMVTEEKLSELAPLLPEHWKKLARKLNMNAEEVEAKKRNEPQEHPYLMLKAWKNEKASDATVRCLCVALFNVGHRLAAETIFPASKRLLKAVSSRKGTSL